MGAGKNILDFEDFLVSNNLLPLGSLIYLLFCTSRYGWGWKKFTEEANSGQGIRFPKWARVYVFVYFASDRAVYLCTGIYHHVLKHIGE